MEPTSSKNEIVSILVKTAIAVATFYLAYFTLLNTTEYPTPLNKFVDVLFFMLMANFMAIVLTWAIFKAMHTPTKVLNRYFNEDSMLAFLVESAVSAFLFTLSILYVSLVSAEEFIYKFVLIKLVVKFGSYVIGKTFGVKLRRMASNQVIAVFIMLFIIVLIAIKLFLN